MTHAQRVLWWRAVAGVGVASVLELPDGSADLVVTDVDGHITDYQRGLDPEHAYRLWEQACDQLDSRPIRHTVWDQAIARALHPTAGGGHG